MSALLSIADGKRGLTLLHHTDAIMVDCCSEVCMNRIERWDGEVGSILCLKMYLELCDKNEMDNMSFCITDKESQL